MHATAKSVSWVPGRVCSSGEGAVIVMRWSLLPNLITSLRMLLVVPAGWLLWQGRYPEALVVVGVAGASDALDGELARRFSWRTAFGSMLDPIADKLLALVVFVIFTVQGHIPVWLLVVVIARDAIILGGAGVYWLMFREIEMAPTLASKANTALQIVMLLLLLLGLCGFGALSSLALLIVDPWSFYLLAILGIGSGIEYAVTWALKAWRDSRRPNP